MYEVNEANKYLVPDTLIRFLAYAIDILVIWSIKHIAIIPVIHMLKLDSIRVIFDTFSIATMSSVVLYFVYFFFMTYLFSQTFGKTIFGLKVMSQNGNKLTIGQVFFREIIGRIISKQLFNLPYLMILFNEKRLGLHDYIGDTLVVNEKSYSYNEVNTGNYETHNHPEQMEVESNYGKHNF
ncbi:RDD family protein [Phocicoccus pinnipedialis]|uniref:RDD family protein n=2 Tax=Phocicoccus pinnipedialis TaxID=110845 RepID=A0A6V7RCJ1_9BACL|nr:RDD family protein [Jeotgalicoccus pinnipedialis]CAD2075082.1 RDD family protein [Jeotgalicoccus pinnipedialis]